jgi:hypothetical protein
VIEDRVAPDGIVGSPFRDSPNPSAGSRSRPAGLWQRAPRGCRQGPDADKAITLSLKRRIREIGVRQTLSECCWVGRWSRMACALRQTLSSSVTPERE